MKQLLGWIEDMGGFPFVLVLAIIAFTVLAVAGALIGAPVGDISPDECGLAICT